jgi:integrase
MTPPGTGRFTLATGALVTRSPLAIAARPGPSTAWRVERAFKTAGLPPYDPHTMRHTFASIADHQDVPYRTIADIMGHHDVTTFQRIYRHRLCPVITDPGDLMDGIWGEDRQARTIFP